MEQVEPPLGIKFWAEHYKTGKPAFRVFRFIAVIEGTSSYVFESVDAPVMLLVKRWDELHSENFKPFLLPMDHIRKTYGEDY